MLKDRGYVRIDKKRLVPEDKGRVVVAFLESFFARYVEYDFTAALEEQLDRVSNNEVAWRDLLRDFWRDFAAAVDDIKDLRIAQVIDALDELLGPHIYPPRTDGADPRTCPTCATGRLSLKLGKFGAFVGCSNYPECRFTRTLAVPEHLRDAHYKGAKRLGHGEGYQYSHEQPGHFGAQDFLGADKKYYEPTEQGAEKAIRERVAKWRAILAQLYHCLAQRIRRKFREASVQRAGGVCRPDLHFVFQKNIASIETFIHIDDGNSS